MSPSIATLPDAVYDALRDRILDQTEPPGTALTESGVAELLGVARPTAKLALERLVADGLLRREAHRTARVPHLGRADIVDLFAARLLVEPAATEALARGGAIPAAALAAHRASLTDARSGRPFARLDAEFHRALVAAQPSPRLARMHAGLMGEIELCIAQVQAGRLIDAARLAEEHARILDAVTAGDGDAAHAHARAHIESSRDALLAHIDDDGPHAA